MHRNISTLPPDRGIADPGAMKSWEAAQLTHNKVTDFPHSTSVFLHSPPCLPFLPLQDPSVPHLSPPRFPSRLDDLAHALCRC